MISLSVPTFTTLTTVVWIIAGLMTLFAFVSAWQGQLSLSLVISAAGAAVFHIPVVGLFLGWIKLTFERQDQLLESSVGKAISAIGLVFAMTGVLPFVVVFGFSAIGCLIVYAIRSFLN